MTPRALGVSERTSASDSNDHLANARLTLLTLDRGDLDSDASRYRDHRVGGLDVMRPVTSSPPRIRGLNEVPPGTRR